MSAEQQTVPSLQSYCVRYFATSPDLDFSVLQHKLPTAIINKILRLRDELKICLNCCTLYHCFNCPNQTFYTEEIVVNDQCTVDWKQSMKNFLKKFDAEQAFRFAAANALEQECSSIWESFNGTIRQYFITSVESPMSFFSASVTVAVRGQTGEPNFVCFDDLLWESLYNGNPYALQHWIEKAKSKQIQVDIFHLVSQLVSENHYHMIDTLCDGFLDEKILPPQTIKDFSNAAYLLAFCPPHWQIKAKKLSDTLYSVIVKELP